jgi:hypothetical protein
MKFGVLHGLKINVYLEKDYNIYEENENLSVGMMK